ncbi:glycosyl hydrolases family 31-domain-containing protein [Aspergillus cavernicola]|uniref:alpha-glucosidase n=1 Tax=Aspergillus cavernicola TaxID=176166 RepID=A0ABR4HQE4_9EURO
MWKAVGAASALCVAAAHAQSTPTSSSPSSTRFTMPASVYDAPPVLPNITDPQAIDAQAAERATYTERIYGTDISSLDLTVEYQAADRLHVGNYLIPSEVLLRPQAEQASGSSDLKISWTNSPSFGFTVTRKSTGDVLFSTEGRKLVFENKFVEFSSSLPENYNLYGVGENVRAFRQGNNYTQTLYAADAGDREPNGERILVNTDETSPEGNYTVHSHGIYQRNAHGQDILLRPDHITWRSIGGSIDLYFFPGPSQPEVTKSYLEVVGLPALQQYWTFGFHQCRWGYKSCNELEQVVNNYINFKISLETIWTDIDYLERYRDFENTTGFWPSGRHYVPIIDSAIYIPNPQNEDDAYPTFERGDHTGSFLKNPDGSLYIGAEGWWVNESVEYYKKVAFDGAWIDMSEVSSFCTGRCGSGKLSLNPVHPPFALPGKPQNLVLDYPEGFSTTNETEAVSASAAVSSSVSAYATSTSTSYLTYATHTDGTLEYEMHNLWGHGILHATYKALSQLLPGVRPFIIGRSTFSGTGAVAGHWGGDNYSKWAYMYFSIPQGLQMSMLGILMFGTDTCGFAGNSDMELCSRWMQLSAFFPFYRNHNTIGSIPQEAYLWAEVIEATVPYIYTLFYYAHEVRHTVLRALAWEFPDPSLAGADRQFLLGSSILVTPALEPRAESVDGIFPGLIQGTETWYDWYNGIVVPDRTLDVSITQGGFVDGNDLRNVTVWGVSGVDRKKVKFNGYNLGVKDVQFDEEKGTLVVSGFKIEAWVGVVK